MPYVVVWREVGRDRHTRSRCHLRQAGAQRKLGKIRDRWPSERRRRLRVLRVGWDYVVFLALIRLLVLGVLLLVVLLGCVAAGLAGWV